MSRVDERSKLSRGEVSLFEELFDVGLDGERMHAAFVRDGFDILADLEECESSLISISTRRFLGNSSGFGSGLGARLGFLEYIAFSLHGNVGLEISFLVFEELFALDGESPAWCGCEQWIHPGSFVEKALDDERFDHREDKLV